MNEQYILYGMSLDSRPIGTEIGLEFTDKVEPRMVELYAGALTDPFLKPRTPVDDPAKELVEIGKSKKGNRVPAFAKVMLGNYPIGIGFPRELSEKAMAVYGLTDDVTWYRIGWWYIDKQYQGNGYGVKAMRLFIKKYKHVFYMAEEDNIASQKVAMRAGMIVCGECFLSEQGEITASNHNFEDKRFIMYRTEH